jgi:hypothetical protein
MGRPNGELDAWASVIVGSRFRYVQVNAYYDQLTVVPEARSSELPSNAFGAWIAAKRASIFELHEAADQISIIAAGLPGFAVSVERVSPGPARLDSDGGPDLERDANGPAWLVREGASVLATARFWELLLDPNTFSD